MKVKPWIDALVWNAPDVGGGGADVAKPDAGATPDAVDPGALLYGDGAAKPDAKPTDPAAKPDAAKADGEAAKPDDKAKEGDKPAELKSDEVPVDGKYAFTMPEGVEIDAALAEQAMPVFKDMGLSRANADKAVKFYAEAKAKEVEAAQANWDKINSDWIASAKADKEYGGDKFDASLAHANRVLSKHGTPELIEYLKVSGGGNHPEVIRFMARVGNAFSDDKPTGSKTVSAVADDPVKIMYS